MSSHESFRARRLARVRVVALALALAVVATASAAVKPGEMFPSLAQAGLTGEVPVFAGHVTVVDFFASWCAPCKASIPALSKIQADYAARGVIVIGIGIDEQPAKHAAFVAKLAPGFVTLHDREQRLVRTVEVPTMPTTFVLGRDGRVRTIHTGFHGAASERELRAEIDAALAAQP
jgi:thiol-disulfide isomerase/thioredoxin